MAPLMSPHHEAFELLRAAFKNPADKRAVKAAKSHPLLKKALTGVDAEDLRTLMEIASAHPEYKGCNDSGTAG